MKYTLVNNEDGEKHITVFVQGRQPLSANSTHPQFEEILARVMKDDESALDLFDAAMAAGAKFDRLTERITARNGRIYLDGEEVNNALTMQILRFLKEGVENWKPLALFFENLMANPNEHSRNALYPWIEKQNISITEDGMMVGYKGLVKIKGEPGVFAPKHDGRVIVDGEVVNGVIRQKVGSLVEMPRSEVMHNPRRDCDAGLHVGSFDYAKGFAEVVVEVHVNPRDVVSVPDSSWKLRCCRYRIVSLVENPHSKAVVPDFKESQAKAKAKPKTAKAKAEKPVEEIRVGDVYADKDARRAGRALKVTGLVDADGKVEVTDEKGKVVKVKAERLTSRAYQRTKRGRKPKEAVAKA